MALQYVKQFNADMGELSLNFGDKHWRRFPANKIKSIQNTKATKKFLFFTKQVDCIEIHVNDEPEPFIIQKGVIGDDFTWIKDVLRSFAAKNKVNFVE